MKEAADKRRLRSRLLQSVKEKGFHFTDCLYCDAIVDQYVVLRASSEFFLADDGSYSGAVEQIIQELAEEEKRRKLWEKLQLSEIRETLTAEHQVEEYFYCHKDGDRVLRGRITLLLPDFAENGNLHHFLVGFDVYQDRDRLIVNEKKQLTQFYEQLTQSILENGNYIEALMDTAEIIQSVNLTQNLLEKIFWQNRENRQIPDIKLPCPYDTYCKTYQRFVTKETRENYRITENPAQLIERFKAGEKQVTVEYQVEKSDGSRCWWQETVLMSQEMVYESKTKQTSTVIGAIILFKDISEFHEQEDRERERLQVAYEKADLESRAKTEFMNRMSHDIRTPINGICGMVDVGDHYSNDLQKQADCRKKIREASNILLELINEVLDMSKLESGEILLEEKPFDVYKTINDVMDLISRQADERGIKVEQTIEIEHRRLLGSSLYLKRMLMNILSNAVKYNKDYGSIDLSCKEIPSHSTESTMLEFTCQDTGIGMSSGFKEHVFESFAREQKGGASKFGGTGLGMTITKNLAEKMGGTITFESEKDKGTTFVLRIPFKINLDADKHKEQKYVSKRSIKNLNILLVEDNELNMEIAEFLLQNEGAQVTKAWNGQEAVEIFEKSRPGGFDVILMDIMMPVMNGYEAAKIIRSLDRKDAKVVPIIAMTANAFTEDKLKAKEAGMDEHIAKPVDVKLLVKVISGLVGNNLGGIRNEKEKME